MNHHNLLKQHSNEMIHLRSTLIYLIPNKFLFSLYDGVARSIKDRNNKISRLVSNLN